MVFGDDCISDGEQGLSDLDQSDRAMVASQNGSMCVVRLASPWSDRPTDSLSVSVSGCLFGYPW